MRKIKDADANHLNINDENDFQQLEPAHISANHSN